MRCGLLAHLGCVWCAVWCGKLWQRWCSDCRRQLGSEDRHSKCTRCRSKPQIEQENLDPLAQLGENATQLMAALPTHSHHRAPLLAILSSNISSTTAAPLLHSSASYIRSVKRRDHSGSDLLQAKYSSGVKRQRLADERVDQLCDYVATACPTKSGERSVSYHQYITDSALYSGYCSTTRHPVSFNTFWRVKRWMRVRRAGRYLGQFDCSRCITFYKLQHKPEAERTGVEAEELRGCILHRETDFHKGSTTSSSVPTCSRGNF